jgi:hypothetical protein
MAWSWRTSFESFSFASSTTSREEEDVDAGEADEGGVV